MHTITKFRVKIYREGTSPGNVYGYIYRTSDNVTTGWALGGQVKDGNELATDNAGAWEAFELSEPITVNAGNMYSIVLANPTGNSTDHICWRYDADGSAYLLGHSENSTDGGITWSADYSTDYKFQIWGNPCLSIEDAKVFTSFIEEDDQLFVFNYRALPSEEYEDVDPRDYLNLQILEPAVTTIVAQIKCPEFGYRPGSIYINADQALAYGENYTIRIAGVTGTAFAGLSGDYVLDPEDWIGEDLNFLDSWVITSARSIGDYYNTTYITELAEGYRLTQTGGVLFTNGIPRLDKQRPGMFTFSKYSETQGTTTHTNTYQEMLNTFLGGRFRTTMEGLGDFLGTGPNQAAGIFWALFVFTLLVAVGAPQLSILLIAFLAVSFAFVGWIPLVYILIPGIFLGILLVWGIARAL
jgi:hypothetical protein